MLDVCLSKGSRDNMTVILICFEAAPSIDPIAVEKEEQWNQEIAQRVQEICDAAMNKGDAHATLDVDFVMRELELLSLDSCPNGLTFHAARTAVDRILEKRRQSI
ncbi:hypothetical protein AB6A40_007445 [Gnathostoma spinigerum]|uniref:Protein serine/threonine phosphatase 2C C-terminal domain-containing protein n=1 Tax=Gnathostoma spinigerum TaxID=75299 RepID=A0ABD6ELS5_9BILA